MLKPTIEKALNDQINAELFSSYLYLSMSAHCESLSLPGAGNWFRIQTQEEVVHAIKLFDYVIERGGKVTLAALEGPKTEWDSLQAVFEAAYEHETKITGLINGLVDLALKESDHATNALLQWFVSEQVEEEATADLIVQKLKMVGGDGGGLFMIDSELASRVFTPPVASPA